jgi:hypothetical protein
MRTLMGLQWSNGTAKCNALWECIAPRRSSSRGDYFVPFAGFRTISVDSVFISVFSASMNGERRKGA